MRTRKDDPIDKFRLQMTVLAVGLEFGVPDVMTAGQRPGERLARQVAMYLVHTVFGLDRSRTARLFARHHSTVGSACATVEDQRDDPVFDGMLTRLERFLAGGRELTP